MISDQRPEGTEEGSHADIRAFYNLSRDKGKKLEKKSSDIF